MKLIKLKNSAQQRKPSTKLRKHVEWEKIFDNDASDNRYKCKIHKKIIQLRKQIIQTQNWAEGQNRHLVVQTE